MQLNLHDLQQIPVNINPLQQVADYTAQHVELAVDNVSLILVDNEEIQRLNRLFRGFDKPTDVLTFECDEEEEGIAGEIMISVEMAVSQAAQAGHDTASELAWLVSHSILHLAGYDDETPEGLAEMIELQRVIMSALNIEVMA